MKKLRIENLILLLHLFLSSCFEWNFVMDCLNSFDTFEFDHDVWQGIYCWIIRLETYPYMFVQTIKLHNSVYPLFIAFWSTSLRLENAEKKKTCMEENGSFIRLLIPTKNTATKSIVLSKKASFNPHLDGERRVDWLCNFCLSFTLAEVKVKRYFIQNKSSLKNTSLTFPDI